MLKKYIACGVFWSLLVICATILTLADKHTWFLWALVIFWAFFGFPRSKDKKDGGADTNGEKYKFNYQPLKTHSNLPACRAFPPEGCKPPLPPKSLK